MGQGRERPGSVSLARVRSYRAIAVEDRATGGRDAVMETQPNFVFVQADQLRADILGAYGNIVAKTPQIDALAGEGVVFERAYCNYPLCAPSRFSMMSGLRATRAGAYDNGAEFPASLPTMMHRLRLAGYQTTLAGKMHFIGPDQLHGFEERLTSDIYPSDFNWTADWVESMTGQTRLAAAAGEVNGVRNAGVYEDTIQMRFDDVVTRQAVDKIHDLAASNDRSPFCLWVSYTHPHDPFAVPRRYWDRYDHGDIDMPAIPALGRDDLDPHSQRLHDHIGVSDAAMTDEDIRTARHAYYGAVSYIDDQLGAVMGALRQTSMLEKTIVVFLSDHGEALGDRGLWFKRSFYDGASRIPLIVRAPRLFEPSRSSSNVSLVDLLPTAVAIAGDPELETIDTAYDGRSLLPVLTGTSPSAPDDHAVLGEMTGEGLVAPAVMVVKGTHKYIHCPTDPPQLYAHSSDPLEQVNLAGDESVAAVETDLRGIVDATWDFDALTAEVIESQRRRMTVDRAHALGRQPSWDWDNSEHDNTQWFRPGPDNPSASNYNSDFAVRRHPDSNEPQYRSHP